MKRLSWFLICLILPSIALAANEYQVAKRVEASMVVTGSIELALDGSVHAYTLDQQNKLPSAVVALVGKTVQGWKFQPVLFNGSPVLAKAAMSLRVVAKKLDGDKYALSVSGASFGKETSGDSIAWKDKVAPRYPQAALDNYVSGTVYLDALVDRQGRVEKVGVEQVDLRNIASDPQMRAWRNVLGRAALSAVSKWTFSVPASSEYADAANRVVRIPVNFVLNYTGSPKHGYGDWDGYVPGPIENISWAQPHAPSYGSADAIPDGGLAFQDDRRFVLLNPPGNG